MDSVRHTARTRMKTLLVDRFYHAANWQAKVRNVSKVGTQNSDSNSSAASLTADCGSGITTMILHRLKLQTAVSELQPQRKRRISPRSRVPARPTFVSPEPRRPTEDLVVPVLLMRDCDTQRVYQL